MSIDAEALNRFTPIFGDPLLFCCAPRCSVLLLGKFPTTNGRRTVSRLCSLLFGYFFPVDVWFSEVTPRHASAVVPRGLRAEIPEELKDHVQAEEYQDLKETSNFQVRGLGAIFSQRAESSSIGALTLAVFRSLGSMLGYLFKTQSQRWIWDRLLWNAWFKRRATHCHFSFPPPGQCERRLLPFA